MHDTTSYREPEYDLPIPSFPSHVDFIKLNDKKREVEDPNAFTNDALWQSKMNAGNLSVPRYHEIMKSGGKV